MSNTVYLNERGDLSNASCDTEAINTLAGAEVMLGAQRAGTMKTEPEEAGCPFSELRLIKEKQNRADLMMNSGHR